MNLRLLVVSCVVFASGWAVPSMIAQEKPMYSTTATRKLANLPGLPTCAMASVESGDPSKGGSVIFAKAEPGCTVPWHWHTSTEQLMMVSGRAKVEMKDGAPAGLRPGDFLAMPSKHVHQFTCVTACTLFIGSDAAFDLHYVDASGKEIAPEEALKAKAAKAEKKMQ